MQRLEFSPGAENVYSRIVSALLEHVRNEPRGFDYRKFSKDASLALASSYGACSGEAVGALLREAAHNISEIYDSSQAFFCLTLLIEAETLDRLLIHVRSPFMPLEIGLAWHPYLNLPFIPASSLKGALRSYMERSGRRICGLGVEELLGSKISASRIVFFDALPVGCRGSLIEADVLTPHYPEAQGVVDEARVKPNPIVFPTVSVGVRFRFVVGVRGVDASNLPCLVKELPSLLGEAFEHGLGAKTSIGYGSVRLTLKSQARGEC